MRLSVRLDDICPGMDWKKYERLTGLLDAYHISPLLGIVPENRDPLLNPSLQAKEDALKAQKESTEADGAESRTEADFWEMLREKQSMGYSLAMHGLHHVYDTKEKGIFPLNGFSEFAGHTEQEQRERLLHGVKILKAHQIETDIFMAPGHTFDIVTLKVLKEIGFHYITDGFGKKPFIRNELVFLPISFRKKDSLNPQKEGFSTLVFHANEMKENDFADFGEILKARSQQFFSYGEWMGMEAKERAPIGNFFEYASACAKNFLVGRGLH